MLRDRYEADPKFWRLIEALAVQMEPELAEVSKLLEDDELYQLIRADLAQRFAQTEETGRNSTPVEVVLRGLAVKRLYQWPYRETVWHMGASLVLRWFCRLYFHPAPAHSTLLRWANTIQPATLEAFNNRVVELAQAAKVTRGRKVRTDGMVVESNIHYPTDSSLLTDGVRVLSRTLKRAQTLVGEQVAGAKALFRDRTRSAHQYARQIGEASRQRTHEARERLTQSYRRLLQITEASVRQAKQTLEILREAGAQQAARLAQTIETRLPRVEQVIDQTVRRLVDGERVPASEKIVSLFAPHTDIIRRNKAHKPTEFGHKVWLDAVEGGIVTRWQVLDGNPDDAEPWQPALDYHLERFKKPLDLMSGDRGLYSPTNEAYAVNKGVKRVVLAKPGRKSHARTAHQRQGWFRRGRRWHAGVEGRISVLDRKHGLDRCPDKGLDGFHRYVGWGCIANNLTVIGRKLAA
ncbi:MAG: ISNCY family transposase [Chloroflexota bacterium]|nr:ISNCY family transposase [Chloroflexota bacterium]